MKFLRDFIKNTLCIVVIVEVGFSLLLLLASGVLLIKAGFILYGVICFILLLVAMGLCLTLMDRYL